MKHALICPDQQVQYISSWQKVGAQYFPVYTAILDSARIAEVSVETFEVASPLFWVDCADDVVADVYYYNLATALVEKTPDPAPIPVGDQPGVTGAQTL